jgi:hypothetical protein
MRWPASLFLRCPHPTKDIHMNEIESSILKEHLPYELAMLELSFIFLNSDKLTKLRSIDFYKNASVECFWLHARNLIEFLTHPPSGGHRGTVSARDFAPSFEPETIMRDMDRRINAGVSHLVYERKSQPEEKLGGYDMLRVKEHIDREIKLFERALLPEYAEIWVPRAPSNWIRTEFSLSSTSSSVSTTSTVLSFGFNPG